MNPVPPSQPTVLLLEADFPARTALKRLLKAEGFLPIEAEDAEEAVQRVRHGGVGVVLLENAFGGVPGLELLAELRRAGPAVPVILMSGFGTIGLAVAAIKSGAFDFLPKPFAHADLLTRLRQALASAREEVPSRRSTDPVSLAHLMGPSRAVQRIIRDVERVAPNDFTVIITGETGSGKELVARTLHQRSWRATGPFVPVDCGAIQPTLIESELFGHEKGAFTGADRARPGKFEAASGGTLFLDEVQNLPLVVQTRFLRAIQERQVCRVGGNKPFDVDLRIVAATNRDLAAEVAAGRFRQDLFHRLNEFAILIPPLRERGEDILYLARRFIDLTCAELKTGPRDLTPEVEESLLRYPWPGNVRELRNVIRRAVLLADGPLEVGHLGAAAWTAPARSGFAAPLGDGDTLPMKEHVRRSIQEAERAILLRVLRETGGNKSRAARILQIDYKTIRAKVRQYNIPVTFAAEDVPAIS